MSSQAISYTTLSPAELYRIHEELAVLHGAPRWPRTQVRDRAELAKRIAIMRATTIKPKADDGTPLPVARPVRKPVKRKRVRKARPKTKRSRPIREYVLSELGKVSHFIYRKNKKRLSVKEAMHVPKRLILSVGYSYAEILERVRRRHPNAKVDTDDLRWTASMIRRGTIGFECVLPDHRVHGNERLNS